MVLSAYLPGGVLVEREVKEPRFEARKVILGKDAETPRTLDVRQERSHTPFTVRQECPCLPHPPMCFRGRWIYSS